MNVKVKDLMVGQVVSTLPHKSIGHAADIMKRNHIKSVPVLNTEKEVVGIITTADIIKAESDLTPVKKVMTTTVYTVPEYADVNIPARIMRNHKIHHLVVTREQKIVGILSSFDLLKLVEDHRYVSKNPPSPSKKDSKRQ